MFFVEEFFLTTRMQLWLLWQKFSTDRPHVILFTSWKKCIIKRFSENFTRKSFTGPVECSFNQPAPRCPARRSITLGSSRPKISEKQVSQKNISARICPLDIKKRSVHQPDKILSPKNPTKLLNQFYRKNLFTENVLPYLQNGSLTKLQKNLFQTYEAFSVSGSKTSKNFFYNY